ncbi:uncharacterized protein LOC119458019 isoform X4 [Dermacentor silvarum]|uniref:uncharacterized protein LOC119458019 isoform X3 n=1 Tax=Dermacentor silvarum TaxID=543639 RepID=UPI00189775BD|nr:uncharacterized protein LOC119458019 isoform X3 [Dermacentor silvarum]XP_049526606.1 uncharacterized protein LOC119458019 isoform X4 [Dermacentor silvarum]
MFKFTFLVLLCSAFVASHMVDFFDDCVEEVHQRQKASECVLLPRSWLLSNTYRNFAHQVLENVAHQPYVGNLNTLLNVTRAATHVSDGIVVRVEFTTVESTCNSSVVYSREQCSPHGSQANGLCQARFLFAGNLTLEDARCGPRK